MADYRELRGARFPMIIAIVVLLYEFFVYNLVFLRVLLPAVRSEVLGVPYLVVFNAFWCLAVWSYVRAHASDPGSVPRRWHEFVRNVGEALPIAPARAEWQPGKATYCQKCLVPRPERAHHCVVCGICVLRMDHHCPWINNCVGFHNYKFFLLTGFYCCVASFIALVTSFPEFVLCLATLLHVDSTLTVEASVMRTEDVIFLLIFSLIAFVFFTLLTSMVASHMPLAALNQTSIENHYCNMPNPFDHGSTIANFAQIFGALGVDWFLPVSPWRPLSDGVSFARAGEHFGADGLPEQSEVLDMVGDEPAIEQLWRLRYSVHLSNTLRTPSLGKRLDTRPLLFFKRWRWCDPNTSADTRRIVTL